MVDIGWAGNLHAALAAAQAAEGVAPAHGYYFGFNEKRLAAFAEARSRFQYDFEDGPEPAFKPGFHQELVEIYLEIFCAADHGTLTGFRAEAGRVGPVLAPGAAARMRALGLPLYRRTLVAVVDALDPAALDLAALEGMRGPIRDLLEAFWMRPTPEEAARLGRLPGRDRRGRRRPRHGARRALPPGRPARAPRRADGAPQAQVLLGRGRAGADPAAAPRQPQDAAGGAGAGRGRLIFGATGVAPGVLRVAPATRVVHGMRIREIAGVLRQ